MIGKLAAAATGLLAGAAALEPPAAPVRGEMLYRQCIACHALESGHDTPAGPDLHAIVGRPIAARPRFNYSPALRRFASQYRVWTPELLDRFIADPEVFVPGTEMGFVGLRHPRDRAALVRWLDARDD